jgi:hypothetical protein
MIAATGTRSTGVSRAKGQTRTRSAFGAWERLEASALREFRRYRAPSVAITPLPAAPIRPTGNVGRSSALPAPHNATSADRQRADILGSNSNRADPYLLTITLATDRPARLPIVAGKLAPDLTGTSNLCSCQLANEKRRSHHRVRQAFFCALQLDEENRFARQSTPTTWRCAGRRLGVRYLSRWQVEARLHAVGPQAYKQLAGGSPLDRNWPPCSSARRTCWERRQNPTLLPPAKFFHG